MEKIHVILLLVIAAFVLYHYCRSKSSEKFSINAGMDSYPQDHSHFWCFANLMNKYYPSGYYEKSIWPDIDDKRRAAYDKFVNDAHRACAGVKFDGISPYAPGEKNRYFNMVASCDAAIRAAEAKNEPDSTYKDPENVITEDFISMPRIAAQLNPWESHRGLENTYAPRVECSYLLRNAAGLSTPELTWRSMGGGCDCGCSKPEGGGCANCGDV